MRKYLLIFCFLAFFSAAKSQDVTGDIITLPAFGEIQIDSSGYLLVRVVNLSASTKVPIYKLRVQLSMPIGNGVKFTNTTVGLPAGWFICSNDGSNMIISNGTDANFGGAISGYEFKVLLRSDGTKTVTNSPIVCQLSAGGGALGTACNSGVQLVGDDLSDNQSTTSVSVFDYTILKSVTDAGNDKKADANEILTYTIKVVNKSAGITHTMPVIDGIPLHTTLVPNSATINGAPVPDADVYNSTDKLFTFLIPARSDSFHTDPDHKENWFALSPSETWTFTFKVKVDADIITQNVTSISNLARAWVSGGQGDVNLDNNSNRPWAPKSSVPASSIAPTTPLPTCIESGFGVGCPTDIPTPVVAPVTLIDFKGRLQQEDVLLNWQTSAEVGFSHYEIERSQEGTRYTKIGTVKGRGAESNYQYLDTGAVEGVNFYRLKMVDLDGSMEYSPVVQINRPFAIGTIGLFPSPTKGKTTIRGLQGDEQLKVMSLNGQLTGIWAGSKGSKEIDLSGKAAGVYYIVVSRKDQLVTTLKVVKE